jgi:hypothetical protein
LSKYSITDLERITGIKAHTLRVWEKRYGLVEPKRGPNNVRCYCEKDLEKLVRVCELNKAGYKISRLACLSVKDLEILYHNKRNFKCDCQGLIDGLTLAVEGFEENRLFRVLHERLQQLEMMAFVLEVVKPLQERLGFLIVSGHFSKLHLDFAENVIESILITENAKLNLCSEHCVGSVLLLHLGPLQPKLPTLILKHFLLKRNVEISMFYLNTSELQSVNEIIERKKFHEVYFCCSKTEDGKSINFSSFSPPQDKNIEYVICGLGMESAVNLPEETTFLMMDSLKLYEHIERKYGIQGQEVDFESVNN